MLTPQEVANRELEKAVFGGYDIKSVEKFLEQVSQDYSTLYRENSILKNKLKVLVDKVEEYRASEDAMRVALLSAEKTAKEITAAAEARREAVDGETEARRSELMHQVETEVEEYRSQLQEQIRQEEAALAIARQSTADFVEAAKSAVAAHVESLRHIHDLVPDVEPGAAPAVPVPAAAAEQSVQPEEKDASLEDTRSFELTESQNIAASVDSIAEIINRSFAAEQPEEPRQAEAAAEPEKPAPAPEQRPRFDFRNLQSGDSKR